MSATPTPVPSATSPSSTTSRSNFPIPISCGQVSLSSFSYLFSELVQYCRSTSDLEKRMFDLGYTIGLKSLELITYRTSIQQFLLPQQGSGSGSGSSSSSSSQSASSGSSNINQYALPISLQNVGSLQGRKEKTVIGMLQTVHSTMWKSLFGRVADGLEKATDKEDEFYIYEISPITNRYISPPKELQHFNCATFIAGILNGILDGAEFHCEVSAHFNTNSAGMTRTVYVIKFQKEIMKRET
jgi:hypothetical protein